MKLADDFAKLYPKPSEKEPFWFTKTLGPKAQAALLARLRPLVYQDGQCSCCGRPRSSEEERALSEALLSWWTEFRIDDDWNEKRTKAKRTTE